MSILQRCRRGLTLLELLVVIFIISILMAVAIPAFRPPIQQRAIREGARAVNSALATARTKAQQTGRNWGIMFEPLESNPWGSILLYFVEVPPAYAGETTSARMRFWNWTYLGDTAAAGKPIVRFTVTFPPGENWEYYVNPGDLLELNHQKQFYRVEDLDPTNSTITLSGDFIFTPAGAGDPPDPPPQLVYPKMTLFLGTNEYSPEYAFRFVRKPTKTSLTPVQLPTSVAVDLQMSGLGHNGIFYDSTAPAITPETHSVIVTFAPTGQLDFVYHTGAPEGEIITDTVHFLIGKPGQYGGENLVDLENIWVSVTHQTGVVTSIENGAVEDASGNLYEVENPPDPVDPDVHVKAARVWAQSGQSMGG